MWRNYGRITERQFRRLCELQYETHKKPIPLVQGLSLFGTWACLTGGFSKSPAHNPQHPRFKFVRHRPSCTIFLCLHLPFRKRALHRSRPPFHYIGARSSRVGARCRTITRYGPQCQNRTKLPVSQVLDSTHRVSLLTRCHNRSDSCAFIVGREQSEVPKIVDVPKPFVYMVPTKTKLRGSTFRRVSSSRGLFTLFRGWLPRSAPAPRVS